MTKPSTRMTITLVAMKVSPKLLISDCTSRNDMDMTTCVSPLGTPRRMIRPA